MPRKISKTGWLALGVAVGSLALAGRSADAASPEDGWVCRRMLYTLLDLSGSYQEQRAQALEALKRVVAALRAGDCLFVKSISQESWSDPNTLLVLKLPPSARPIDPAHQRRLAQAKAQALTRLETLKAAPKDPYTDLWCSVFAASRALQNRAGEKHLLVYTDLRDNRRRKACQQLRLEGVTVTVRFIPRSRGEDPAAFEQRIRFWAQAFKQAGAGPVQFFDLDGLPILEEKKP